MEGDINDNIGYCVVETGVKVTRNGYKTNNMGVTGKGELLMNAKCIFEKLRYTVRVRRSAYNDAGGIFLKLPVFQYNMLSVELYEFQFEVHVHAMEGDPSPYAVKIHFNDSAHIHDGFGTSIFWGPFLLDETLSTHRIWR